MTDPKELRRRLKEQHASMEATRELLTRAERECSHNWTEPKYDPIVREAHTEPGHMHIGAKWLDVEVPRQETPRWRRECLRCGKTEETQQVTEHVSRSPKFGGA